jgi:crotonobetainyl-CoA:carnitine CoA-transferase CaiB-like acyl-CoA transferase
MENNNKGVLHGIRVLDLGRYQAGPRCTLMLARMGAEVIKVEKIGGEDGRSFPPQVRGSSIYWAQYNSGKKSLAINLRHEKGKEVLRQLVKISDIFLQNFQPGIIAEMGFSYEVLHSLNPRIVMVNVSGYGQYGPYRDRPGLDVIGQAMSGLMSLTGFPDTPPTITASPVVDRITSLHACIAALGALRERDISGEGQAIDVCLADTGYTLTEIPISAYLETGDIPQRLGNRLGVVPTNTYKAKDGWVYIISPTEHTFKRCVQLVGKPEWAQDPGFTNPVERWDHADEIDQAIGQWVGERTVAQAVEEGTEADIPIAPVNDIPTAANDPHLWERELLVRVPDPKAGEILAAGKMIKFSRSPVIVGPVPAPGEHNGEILGGLLGYSAAQIEQLHEEGAI